MAGCLVGRRATNEIIYSARPVANSKMRMNPWNAHARTHVCGAVGPCGQTWACFRRCNSNFGAMVKPKRVQNRPLNGPYCTTFVKSGHFAVATKS